MFYNVKNQMEKHLLISLVGVTLIFSVILTILVANFQSKAKYTIYAADHIYHTNQFNVSGNTIYFRDIDKTNVCINGNYTLIYETQEK